MFNSDIFQQIAMVNYFSQLKGQGLAKSPFCYTSSFLKNYFIIKKNAILGTFGFFFVGCPSTVFVIQLLIYFSNFFAIMEWYAFTCFFRI